MLFNVTSNTTIYVLAPANHHTGGVELAHQLVDYLRTKSLNCFIVYIQGKSFVKANIRDEYKKYNIAVTGKVEDSKDNVLIVPEIYSAFIRRFKTIQIGFWWMSVDNYMRSLSMPQKTLFFLRKKRYRLIVGHLIRRNLWESNSMTLKELRRQGERIVHLYQSTYAKRSLLDNKMSCIWPLSDYINSEVISSDKCEKENIILYNPAKGIRFTEKIIKKLPTYSFVALRGLSREQLATYFSKAKLYIDFGDHPGKDRLPREAALNGCCIITSKEGAAVYFEDIPIPAKYKFVRKRQEIISITKRIEEIIDNYPNHIDNFSFYRERILKEKERFYLEVNELFLHD